MVRNNRQHAAASSICFRYFPLMADANHDELGSGVSFFESAKPYE
jgi:hypothetical protein